MANAFQRSGFQQGAFQNDGETPVVIGRSAGASVLSVTTRAVGVVFRAPADGPITGGTWGIRRRRRNFPVVEPQPEEPQPVPVVGRGEIFFQWETLAAGEVSGPSLAEQLDEELALIALALTGSGALEAV